MKVGEVLLDWLTLTTYERTKAGRLYEYLRAQGELEKSQRLQYVGGKSEKGFFGEGKQEGRTHFLFQTSGEAADDASELLSLDARTTRLDLQITIPVPGGYSARALKDSLVAADVWPTGKRRNLTLVEGVRGLDTIYIGSRSSERYIRIYVKEMSETRYLRLEVEYKGGMAYQAATQVRTGRRNELLAGEIDALPQHDVLDAFLEAVGTSDGERLSWEARGESNTMKWLRKSVAPALERLLLDHSEGPVAREIIKDVLHRTSVPLTEE